RRAESASALLPLGRNVGCSFCHLPTPPALARPTVRGGLFAGRQCLASTTGQRRQSHRLARRGGGVRAVPLERLRTDPTPSNPLDAHLPSLLSPLAASQGAAESPAPRRCPRRGACSILRHHTSL